MRDKPTDVSDLWRCLEIAYAAGVKPEHFDHADERHAREVVRALFDERDGPGMRALVAEQGLSAQAADQRLTRIRALVDRVLG